MEMRDNKPTGGRSDVLSTSYTGREILSSRISGKGLSIRAIARMLKRSPSTISRELRRNRGKRGYHPYGIKGKAPKAEGARLLKGFEAEKLVLMWGKAIGARSRSRGDGGRNIRQRTELFDAPPARREYFLMGKTHRNPAFSATRQNAARHSAAPLPAGQTASTPHTGSVPCPKGKAADARNSCPLLRAKQALATEWYAAAREQQIQHVHPRGGRRAPCPAGASSAAPNPAPPNPAPQTRRPKPGAQTRRPKPGAPNPAPQTRRPKPGRPKLGIPKA